MLLFLSIVGTTFADDILVPDEQSTISAAIAAADTAGGDRILVSAGTYVESLVIDRNITIIGAGQGVTRLETGGTTATITVTDVELTLEGFTVSGEDITRALAISGTGAVVSVQSSSLELGNNAGDTSLGGGLVSLIDGEATFTETTLTGTALTGLSRGGLILVDGGTITLDNSELLQGRAVEGTAIYGTDCSLNLSQSTVNGSEGGPALQFYGCSGLFEDVTVSNTTGTNASVILSGGDWELLDVLFENNMSTTGGGHLYAASSVLSIVGGTFRSGEGTSGGALLSTNSTVQVSGALFETNTAFYGGHIAAQSGTIEVRESTFLDGLGKTAGGAIRLFPGTTASIIDNTFTENRAPSGGAVEADTSTTIVRNDFCGNTAYSGSNGAGGHIHIIDSEATITNNLLRDGRAKTGGGVAGSGTAILSIYNNTLLENDGSQNGGASIAALDTAQVEVINTIIAYSTGDEALYADSGASLDVSYSILFNNDSGDNDNGVLGTGMLLDTDPQFVSYTIGTCDGDFRLDLASDAIDNGDPSIDDPILARSPSDIGALGGPEASPEDWADDDLDDWPVMWDCDDGDATALPGGQEVCDLDLVDEDCDTLINEDDSSVTGTLTTWLDNDGDGLGDDTTEDLRCPGDGIVDDNTDCDDTDPAIGGPTDWYLDFDGDGRGAGVAAVACDAPQFHVANNDDCNDLDSDVFELSTFWVDADDDGYGDPLSASEECGLRTGFSENDLDCDDSDADLNPETIWFDDADEDGFGDDATETQACSPPSDTYIRVGGDCDDSDATLFPGNIWYVDADGDGFGDDATAEEACAPSIPGMVLQGGDCDDNDATILADITWYLDDDGDGYGVETTIEETCTPSPGFVQAVGDCDDTDADINPGALERCNGLDDDCDGDIDEDAEDADTYYEDADGDGYGIGSPILSCVQPPNTSLLDGDCDDSVASSNPGAPELCQNGLDDNCDGQVDETADISTWYRDEDGDGYGSDTDTLEDCEKPEGYVLDGGDCDDTLDTVNPGAEEIWYDGIDQDCDGQDDDQDNDGFERAEDCDDLDPAINPSAEEIPDNDIDEDCDGSDKQDGVDSSRSYDPTASGNTAQDLLPVGTGCACSSGPGSSPLLPAGLLLLVLVGARRGS